jgi:hypothetical protein
MEETSMTYRVFACTALLAIVAACSSSPYAPVNQASPIRQMDNAFDGRPLNAPPPGTYRAPPSSAYYGAPSSSYGSRY